MSSTSFQPVQGMPDIAPPDSSLWQRLESTAREVLALYGFAEIRTPILEHTRIFTRSIGDTTDVVQKEMYTFEDRGGRSLTLRPEGTAGVMRYVANAGPEALDARLYYLGPMFRSERTQAGRYRQFYQLGVEALGPPNPPVDAESIALQRHVLDAWGLSGSTLQLNTRGGTEDMRRVQEGLKQALGPLRERLCDSCKRRYDMNVLRILDCKDEQCRKLAETLPAIIDFMGDEATRYFDELLQCLERLEIPFTVNRTLVRGLDYYTHTIWEVLHPALGAQDSLSGGGRYHITMGNKKIEGVGFAMGLERIIVALRNVDLEAMESDERPDLFIVSHGREIVAENLLVAQLLRQKGVACRIDLSLRSIKAQMRAANRSGAPYALIRGELEMEKGLFLLKNMEDGSQEELVLADVLKKLGRTRDI